MQGVANGVERGGYLCPGEYRRWSDRNRTGDHRFRSGPVRANDPQLAAAGTTSRANVFRMAQFFRYLVGFDGSRLDELPDSQVIENTSPSSASPSRKKVLGPAPDYAEQIVA